MSLQYRADTGQLLMLATGELQAECCCEAEPCGDCEACTPPLAETYNLTVPGGYVYPAFPDNVPCLNNIATGTHVLTKTGVCTWKSSVFTYDYDDGAGNTCHNSIQFVLEYVRLNETTCLWRIYHDLFTWMNGDVTGAGSPECACGNSLLDFFLDAWDGDVDACSPIGVYTPAYSNLNVASFEVSAT
jgi:hypothetical protein